MKWFAVWQPQTFAHCSPAIYAKICGCHIASHFLFFGHAGKRKSREKKIFTRILHELFQFHIVIHSKMFHSALLRFYIAEHFLFGFLALWPATAQAE